MDDLISRQVAIDAMAELQGMASTKAELKAISKAWKWIKKLPSAQQKGKWIYLAGLDTFECSVCGRQMVRNIFDYCPWCGAEMVEEDE